MGPEVAAVAILGLVVLILGAFGAAFFTGRQSRQAAVDSLERESDRLRAALEALEAKTTARARGAVDDTARAVDRALATDADGVLDAVYGGSDTAPGESRDADSA